MSSDTILNIFWERPEHQDVVFEDAQFDIIYKCKGKNGCGRNIPNANIRGNLIRCDNCGKTYTLVPIKWSGQFG